MIKCKYQYFFNIPRVWIVTEKLYHERIFNFQSVKENRIGNHLSEPGLLSQTEQTIPQETDTFLVVSTNILLWSCPIHIPSISF